MAARLTKTTMVKKPLPLPKKVKESAHMLTKTMVKKKK